METQQEVILIKLGELVLKGLNRRVFEDALIQNIRRRLQGAGEFSTSIAQSTIYVQPEGDADLDEAVQRIFQGVRRTQGAFCDPAGGGTVPAGRAGNRTDIQGGIQARG